MLAEYAGGVMVAKENLENGWGKLEVSGPTGESIRLPL